MFLQKDDKISIYGAVALAMGGFHLHLLGFPFVYQFKLQIELEPNLLVHNPVELIISPTFQNVLISCVT